MGISYNNKTDLTGVAREVTLEAVKESMAKETTLQATQTAVNTQGEATRTHVTNCQNSIINTVNAKSAAGKVLFTQNGTFTVPPGVTHLEILAFASGGDGTLRSGGQRGEYWEGIQKVTPGESIALTVGFGNTVFGNYFTLLKGNGGTGDSPYAKAGGGYYNTSGGAGGYGGGGGGGGHHNINSNQGTEGFLGGYGLGGFGGTGGVSGQFSGDRAGNGQGFYLARGGAGGLCTGTTGAIVYAEPGGAGGRAGRSGEGTVNWRYSGGGGGGASGNGGNGGISISQLNGKRGHGGGGGGGGGYGAGGGDGGGSDYQGLEGGGGQGGSGIVIIKW